MKRFVSLFLAVLLVCGALLTMSSCGKKNQTFEIYLSDQVYDFDPAMAFVEDDAQKIMNMLFEPLFTVTEKGKIEKALAQDFRIIEDEEKGIYQMEITLRETYWSDASQVTADDVAYAWERIIEPTFSSQAAPLLYDIKNAAAIKRGDMSISDFGVEADKDVLTITFEGKIDYEAFMRNLASVALAPVRQNTVSKATDYWAKRSSIVTNGPFKVREWDKDTGSFSLERNPYYRSEEKLEKAKHVLPAMITMQWTAEDFYTEYDGNMNKFLQSKLDSLLNDTIFYVGKMPTGTEVRETYADDVQTADLLSTYSYIFNTNKDLFKDERVRLALSLAIDRQAIADMLVYAKAATGLISAGVWNDTSYKTDFRTDNDILSTSANMAKAEELLGDAGVYSGDFTLTIRDDQEEYVIAKYMKEQWEKLGFTVTIERLTYDEREVNFGASDSKITVYDDSIQNLYASGNFDVLGIDYQMYSTNAFTALCGFSTTLNGNGAVIGVDSVTGLSTCTPKLHCSGFSDATYDEMIDRALAEKDLTKRAVILHEAEEYLLSKMPIMPIVFNQNYYMTNGLYGLSTDAFGLVSFTNAKSK